jgi:Icc-related predicted phosphoesterase
MMTARTDSKKPSMRCHYMSDLHLEAQEFRHSLPRGDVLIVAGDLCHASALDPARTDPYRVKQRDRVLRFIDAATSAFAHVLLVPGNHEHYEGIFEDTASLLRRHLPGVTTLDDEAIELGGVRFFGTTLWSDLDRRDPTAMEQIRRGMGEYFFTKTRGSKDDGRDALVRLRPHDTLAAHDRALAELRRKAAMAGAPMVVISHHGPSLQGLNPQHKANGLDGAFASDLDELIAALPNTPYWVHGHTHIRKRYRIGNTTMLANCRGFEGKDLSARGFSPDCYFDV